MGQSKLELAVGTGQWDAGLKKAQQALNAFTQSQGGLQQALEKDNGDMQKFIQMMGKMESTANTAKGQMNEYKKVLEQLTAQYNQMSDAQKNSIGQDYLKTIESIKVKYQEAKSQVDTFNKSLGDSGESAKGTSGILDQLKDRFTVNVDAVKMFQMGLSAAKAALDVAKDAFFNNEQMLDEWGRSVESAESVYKGFLNSLNTGDISGFLSNINTITQAARDAYDALDELSTFTAFNKANVAGARADLTGAIADYREGTGGKDAVKEASENLIKELETKQKLQEDAYKKVIAKVAAERNVNAEDLLKVMQGKYGSFKELKDLEYTSKRTRIVSAGGTFATGPVMQSITEAVPANERERLAQAVKHLNDTEIDNFQSIAEAAKMTEVEINNQRKMVARVLNGKQGSGSGNSSGSGGGGNRKGGVSTEITYAADSITAMEKEVSELTKLWKDAGAAVRDQYAAQLAEAKLRLDEINGKSKKIMFDSEQAAKQVGFSQGKNAAQTSGLGNIDSFKNFKVDGLTPEALEAANKWMKDMEEGGNKVQKSWKNAASAIGLVGQAMASVKDPAAQIASTVAMAIANIAMAYSETLAKDKTNKSNIWYFIATAAAAMVSMTTTIASIHSATGYAQGGEIKGNSYSGDNIAGLVDGKQLIGLNAGEIVLNQAQQANVAHGLQGAGGNLHLEGILQGENILISTNRTAKRKGYGELMFWQGG